MSTAPKENADIEPAVGPNEQVLYDENREILHARKIRLIEEELSKVAGNNWPKATATLLKKYKKEKFSVDPAIIQVKHRMEYQLATVDDCDDFGGVLWALAKSKKHSASGRSDIAAMAIMTGRLMLLHYMLKQGSVYFNMNGSAKKPKADKLLHSRRIDYFNKWYSKCHLAFLLYCNNIALHGFPTYSRNRGLFPSRKEKEPSYRKWVPELEPPTPPEYEPRADTKMQDESEPDIKIQDEPKPDIKIQEEPGLDIKIQDELEPDIMIQDSPSLV